jgi:hypothetical protein
MVTNSQRNLIIKDKKLLATPCIINGWFSLTYENPGGFSIRFLFAKLGA